MSDVAGPGYYAAQGDPAGSVRYWDGSQWSSEPMPPPPGWEDGAPDSRFAGFWIRVGASLLDGLITLILVAPFLFPTIKDTFDQLDAGVEADQIDTSVPPAVYLVGIATTGVFILMVAFLGGTPGKLILKLRITSEDGSTTPPGLGRAGRRALPQIIGSVPLIGPLVGLAAAILSVVWVNTDHERRSAYDRIAGTRVVHARSIAPAILTTQGTP